MIEKRGDHIVVQNDIFTHLTLWTLPFEKAEETTPVTAICAFCENKTELRISEGPFEEKSKELAQKVMEWTAAHKKCKGS